jgi:hypothetical protein
MRKIVIESSQRTTLRLVGAGEGESGSALSPFGPVKVRFDNYAYPNQQWETKFSAYGIAQLLGEKDSRSEYQILRGLRYI